MQIYLFYNCDKGSLVGVFVDLTATVL